MALDKLTRNELRDLLRKSGSKLGAGTKDAMRPLLRTCIRLSLMKENELVSFDEPTLHALLSDAAQWPPYGLGKGAGARIEKIRAAVRALREVDYPADIVEEVREATESEKLASSSSKPKDVAYDTRHSGQVVPEPSMTKVKTSSSGNAIPLNDGGQQASSRQLFRQPRTDVSTTKKLGSSSSNPIEIADDDDVPESGVMKVESSPPRNFRSAVTSTTRTHNLSVGGNQAAFTQPTRQPGTNESMANFGATLSPRSSANSRPPSHKYATGSRPRNADFPALSELTAPPTLTPPTSGNGLGSYHLQSPIRQKESIGEKRGSQVDNYRMHPTTENQSLSRGAWSGTQSMSGAASYGVPSSAPAVDGERRSSESMPRDRVPGNRANLSRAQYSSHLHAYGGMPQQQSMLPPGAWSTQQDFHVGPGGVGVSPLEPNRGDLPSEEAQVQQLRREVDAISKRQTELEARVESKRGDITFQEIQRLRRDVDMLNERQLKFEARTNSWATKPPTVTNTTNRTPVSGNSDIRTGDISRKRQPQEPIMQPSNAKKARGTEPVNGYAE